MIDFQYIILPYFLYGHTIPNLRANIVEDVSGKRIKCTGFEGFTPTS